MWVAHRGDDRARGLLHLRISTRPTFGHIVEFLADVLPLFQRLIVLILSGCQLAPQPLALRGKPRPFLHKAIEPRLELLHPVPTARATLLLFDGLLPRVVLPILFELAAQTIE